MCEKQLEEAIIAYDRFMHRASKNGVREVLVEDVPDNDVRRSAPFLRWTGRAGDRRSVDRDDLFAPVSGFSSREGDVLDRTRR